MSIARSEKIRVRHALPSAERPFVMLPVGLYCNSRLRKARSGTLVEFWDGWRHGKYTLVQKCEIPIASSAFTFISKAIYGTDVNYNALCRKWEAECIVEGLGRNGFDRDKVLVIEVKKIEKNVR